ncbi:hypothetical protein HDU98_005464, partial [Podochytrium sp. JEL0797]
SNLNLVTGELKNPSRNLPLAVFIGPSIVIIAYLLVNLSYYLILDSSIIAVTKSVALDFGNHVLGTTASSIIIPLIVLGSTFGACNASIFTGSRISSSAALRNQIPFLFSHVHPTHQTPVNALVLQATLASLFCLAATFEPLVTMYSNIIWVFYFFTVFGGIILLRVTNPEMDRPFRVPMGIAVAFCGAAVLLVFFSVYERPAEGGFGALFLLVGVVVWWVKEYYSAGFLKLVTRICGIFGYELRGGEMTGFGRLVQETS